MKFLVDTHILLWMTGMSSRLPPNARELIEDIENTIAFSTVSIWEVAIKTSLKRFSDFNVDPERLRRNLLANGYEELPLRGEHAVTIRNLPQLHGDPFDRILIAQALTEGLWLLTADKTVAKYGGLIRLM